MIAQPQCLPPSWRWGVLGEVLHSIDAGKSFNAQQRPAEPEERGVLKISAVTWGEFRYQENKALQPESDPTGVPTVCAGDLLITRANTVELVGAVAMARKDHPNLVLSDKTLRLNPDPKLSDSKYLLYALRTRIAREHLESHATGTSGSMRNITQVNIRNTPIPIPPVDEQRRIAAILDRADAVRRKRQEAIALTEELLRSTFLEMFGDPATNPKGWRTVPMTNVVSETQYGTAEKANSERIGIPVLRMNNITYSGEINLEDIKWCSINSEDEAKFTVQRGDLLFNRTNSPELVGKTAVWRSDEKYAFAGYLVRVRFQTAQVLSEFVSAYLNSSFGKRYLFEKAKPSNNMSNFSASEFLKIPLLLPPVELQEHFVSIADAARTSITRLEGAIKDSDNLFNSLLQRAFRAEL